MTSMILDNIVTTSDPVAPVGNLPVGKGLRLAKSALALSPADQATLKRVLAAEPDYMDSPEFHVEGAERAIFDQAPIRKPDVSWYHPVMDSATPVRSVGKNAGSVLLTGGQEKVLFLQFNYARFQIAELRPKLLDKAITLSEAKAVLRWNAKVDELRDQLASTNLALVLAMAKRTRMSEVDFGDLISEGNMALLRAIDKFDVGRGFKFSTYACRAILQAFSRSGMKLSRYRQMFPTDFDPKLEKSDFLDRKREESEVQAVDEVRSILRDNVAELSDIEQAVLRHRFALDNREDSKAMTLEEVGRIIGVTKERVRQIQNKALVKLRERLEDRITV